MIWPNLKSPLRWFFLTVSLLLSLTNVFAIEIGMTGAVKKKARQLTDEIQSQRSSASTLASVSLSATALGVSSITWSWTEVPDITAYRIISSTGSDLSGLITANSTSWTETGLSTNTVYSRRLVAILSTENSTSSLVSAYSKAAAPDSISLLNVFSSSISVVWGPNTNPASDTSYQVRYWTPGSSTSTFSAGTGVAVATITGLTPLSTYYLTIRALNGDAVTTASGVMLTTTTRSGGTTWGITGSYFMAFHTCSDGSSSCGPQTHTTYVAQSTDGINWSSISGFSTFGGSVPDIIRKGNKLYMYNTSGVARYDLETSSYQATVEIQISSASGAKDYYADPSPILDENGKITLFYLAHDSIPSYDPAGCPDSNPCNQYFRSATEVDGSDGTQFLVNSGNRYSLQMCSTCTYTSASDPDIFVSSTSGIYNLFISHGGSTQVLYANSLKGSYQNMPGLSNGQLTSAGGVPAGYYDSSSSKYWIFVHSGSPAGIKRAVVNDLNTLIPESQFSVAISSTSGIYSLGNPSTIESPGFAVNSP